MPCLCAQHSNRAHDASVSPPCRAGPSTGILSIFCSCAIRQLTLLLSALRASPRPSYDLEGDGGTLRGSPPSSHDSCPDPYGLSHYPRPRKPNPNRRGMHNAVFIRASSVPPEHEDIHGVGLGLPCRVKHPDTGSPSLTPPIQHLPSPPTVQPLQARPKRKAGVVVPAQLSGADTGMSLSGYMDRQNATSVRPFTPCYLKR